MDIEKRTGTIKNGYSLVEMLVASILITLSILAVVAMIYKGEEMIQVDKHRRTARYLIESALENQMYSSAAYNGLASLPATQADSVTIEGTTPPLRGLLTRTISAETINVVPYRLITFTVSWKERNMNAAVADQMVVITKVLTNL